jgi:prepilin-type processing-associated H-X9-DG protein
MNLSQLNGPSQSILLCEISTQGTQLPSQYGETDSPAVSGFTWISTGGPGLNVSSSASTGYAMGPIIGAKTTGNGQARHGGGAGTNVALADGHVKFMSGTRVSPGYNAQGPYNDTAVVNGNGYYAAGSNFLGKSAGIGASFQATFSAI